MEGFDMERVNDIEYLKTRQFHEHKGLLNHEKGYDLKNETLEFFVSLNNDGINYLTLLHTLIMKFDKFIELVDIIDAQRKHYYILNVICQVYGLCIRDEGLNNAREKYHERFLYVMNLYRNVDNQELILYCSESYLNMTNSTDDNFYLRCLPHAYAVHELIIKQKTFGSHNVILHILYMFMYLTCSPQSVLDGIEMKIKSLGNYIKRKEAKKGYTLIFDDV